MNGQRSSFIDGGLVLAEKGIITRKISRSTEVSTHERDVRAVHKGDKGMPDDSVDNLWSESASIASYPVQISQRRRHMTSVPLVYVD